MATFVSDPFLDNISSSYKKAQNAFVRMIKNIPTSIAKAIMAERLRAELNQLSDRELNDLGISRYDIPAISRGEYVRPSDR